MNKHLPPTPDMNDLLNKVIDEGEDAGEPNQKVNAVDQTPVCQCPDCGAFVPCERTHNGFCYVYHAVHCGWGFEATPVSDTWKSVTQLCAENPNLADYVKTLEELSVEKEKEIVRFRGALERIRDIDVILKPLGWAMQMKDIANEALKTIKSNEKV